MRSNQNVKISLCNDRLRRGFYIFVPFEGVILSASLTENSNCIIIPSKNLRFIRKLLVTI